MTKAHQYWENVYYAFYLIQILNAHAQKRNMKPKKMFLMWLEKGDLHVHSEYRMGSLQ